jgi:uncharacterized damage-inducible protein DinB
MALSVQTLRALLAYTIWADRQVLAALAEVPEEDLVRETGVSFGNVLGTMAHILGAEQLWLSRFLGVPMGGAPTVEDFPTFESLRSSFEDFWPQLEVFLASLTYHRGQVVAQLAQLGRNRPSTDLVYWHGEV